MILKNKRECPRCGAGIETEFRTAPANVKLDSPVTCLRCGWQTGPGQGLAGSVLQSKGGW
jgi:hypothetical protein